ncbi:MAG: hypothetical protein IJU10_02430 [Clostridia bacterium]|nr:hypothetical protein [Clostridia bacterium]
MANDIKEKFRSIAIKGEAKNGYVTVVRYDRSFIARIIQNDAAKRYYSELKNYALSFGIKSRISWKFDTFYLGRTSFAIVKVKGRTLYLYLSLDPTGYDENIYHHKDVSDVKTYENCPMMVKVRSDLGLKKAKELLKTVAEARSLTEEERPFVDYEAELPYEETRTLILKGLIKEVETRMKEEEAERVIAEAESADVNDEEAEWVEFEVDESEDDEGEEVEFELAEDGEITEIRYDRSFTARIIQNDKAKEYYSDIKNFCLGFPLKSRISWKADTFRKGRCPYVMVKVRGKTLVLYLALDPQAYDENIYHHKDVSDLKTYVKCPMMVRVRSDLALRKAKMLIREMMQQADLHEKEIDPIDYTLDFPYEETDALIEKKLIKKIVRRVGIPAEGELPPEIPDDDAEEVEFELADEDTEEVEFELADDEEPQEAEPEEENEDAAEEEDEEGSDEVEFELVDASDDISGDMDDYEELDAEGRYVTLKKYERSFVAKMKQGSTERKDRYAAIKSEMLSYAGVKVRSSFAGETYMYGRQPLLKSRIRGKTLCLFFALDPEDYPVTVYHQQDKSKVRAYVDTPMMVRVKSELGMDRAFRLIEELIRLFALVRGEKKSYRDEYRFEETEALVEQGLIKARIVTVPRYEAEGLLKKK